ncbi:hypothetical protein GF415_02355 [Candidatus Micrarchaeota archaeon]|nr:hypothetical protein [Candidatus Micrarchaeota archaeon]
MVSKEEIDEVMEWCEEVKKKKGIMYTVERNPFRDNIKWMARFPLIEIDRPKETANKRNLVYDSSVRKLWQYMNDTWMEIVPDVDLRIGLREKE